MILLQPAQFFTMRTIGYYACKLLLMAHFINWLILLNNLLEHSNEPFEGDELPVCKEVRLIIVAKSPVTVLRYPALRLLPVHT
jgi:hypothetical protein